MIINPVRLRELCAKGLNAHQIAIRLGVTPNAVHQRAKALGLSVVAGKRSDCLVDYLGRNA